MQLTIDRKQLDSILTRAVTAVAANPVIPSLSGVRLTLTQRTLTVITSNVDVSLVQSIPVQDTEHPLKDIQPDDILLPARYLQKLIKKFTGDTVKFKSSDKPGTIYVSSGRSKFKLGYQKGSVFPNMPQIGQSQHYQITNLSLQTIFKQDLMAASTNESRPVLTGINFNIQPAAHQLRTVATDSHRLSRTTTGVQALDDDQTKINETISSVSLKALQKITNHYPDDQIIDLFHSTQIKQIKFQVDNLTIYTHTLEGNYPDTERLLPQNPKLSLTLDRREFFQVMDRMTLAAGSDQVANLTVNPAGSAEIAINDPKDVRSAKEELETKEVQFIDKTIQNDAFKIAFNIEYIKDGLRAMSGDTVILHLWNTLRPFTLTDPADEHFLYLVTPVRTF